MGGGQEIKMGYGGLAGYQPRSRFSEKPFSKKKRQRVVEQSTWCTPLASVYAHKHTFKYAQRGRGKEERERKERKGCKMA